MKRKQKLNQKLWKILVIVKMTEDENESDSELEFEQTEEQNMFILQKYVCEE